MPRLAGIWIMWFAFLSGSALAQGTPPKTDASTQRSDSTLSAAQKLQRATTTVRIWSVEADQDEVPAADGRRSDAKDDRESTRIVTVCSGVFVRENLLITAAFLGSDAAVRLTLPGGKQAAAQLLVIDEYSGLALLKTDSAHSWALECATTPVNVGDELLTAAAWGVEEPLLSRGILSGADRQRLGPNYPPLLQCDLRTTETSSGAAVVNGHGQLVGILVATDRLESQRGWAYAVPASHVERLLRAADGQKPGSVTVLKRRRPFVGMVLDQDGDAIVVQRVTEDGPAAKAGIKPGDHILASGGVEIRSVYQAVLPTLSLQPGDTLPLRIQRGDQTQDVTVILGGGIEVTSAQQDLLAGIIQPKIEITRSSDGKYIAQRHGTAVREVFSPPLPEDDAPPAAGPTSREKIALLEKAIERYQAVIEAQQGQLSGERKRRQEQEELIQSLRTEMEALRRQLEEAKAK